MTIKQEFMTVDHEWTGMPYSCLALHAAFLERMDFKHVTVLGFFYCLGSRVSNFCFHSKSHTAVYCLCHVDAKSLVLKLTPGTKCLNIFLGSLFRSLNRGYNVILGQGLPAESIRDRKSTAVLGRRVLFGLRSTLDRHYVELFKLRTVLTIGLLDFSAFLQG